MIRLVASILILVVGATGILALIMVAGVSRAINGMGHDFSGHFQKETAVVAIFGGFYFMLTAIAPFASRFWCVVLFAVANVELLASFYFGGGGRDGVYLAAIIILISLVAWIPILLLPPLHKSNHSPEPTGKPAAH